MSWANWSSRTYIRFWNFSPSLSPGTRDTPPGSWARRPSTECWVVTVENFVKEFRPEDNTPAWSAVLILSHHDADCSHLIKCCLWCCAVLLDRSYFIFVAFCFSYQRWRRCHTRDPHLALRLPSSLGERMSAVALIGLTALALRLLSFLLTDGSPISNFSRLLLLAITGFLPPRSALALRVLEIF